MALSQIGGNELVSLTKINNCIVAVNEFTAGNPNQFLVKNTGTDFDVEYTNSFNWLKSGSTINLTTLTVGTSATFFVKFNDMNSESNRIVKCYDNSNSGNFIVGKVVSTGVYGTNTFDVQVISKGGSGTISNWNIIPYRIESVTTNTQLTKINEDFTFPNSIFQSDFKSTGFGAKNGVIGALKKDNICTVSGFYYASITVDNQQVNGSLLGLITGFRGKDNINYYGSGTLIVERGNTIIKVQPISVNVYNNILSVISQSDLNNITDINDHVTWSFTIQYELQNV